MGSHIEFSIFIGNAGWCIPYRVPGETAGDIDEILFADADQMLEKIEGDPLHLPGVGVTDSSSSSPEL